MVQNGCWAVWRRKRSFHGRRGGVCFRLIRKQMTGEVLVSSTVRDLVAGSGLSFRDRGVQPLKGVPGEGRLFEVER
jgi:class 3 adenylate cyclase